VHPLDDGASVFSLPVVVGGSPFQHEIDVGRIDGPVVDTAEDDVNQRSG
jgi:hypothetical protein